MSNAVSGSGNAGGKGYAKELIILTSLFFMWGLLTSLNGILYPHLQGVFELNKTQAMLIQVCFFMAFFIMSLPSGVIVKKLGYRKGIVVGLAIAGVGCLLFYPAATIQQYWIFLGALFVMASGITVLQVAANPYVTVLGKPETASSRLNLTQALNSLGTTVAPYLGSVFILSSAIQSPEQVKMMSALEKEAYNMQAANAVQGPYIVLAVLLFVIALFFALIKLPEIVGTDAAETKTKDSGKKIWQYKHLMLGVFGIFFYVGAEVAIGTLLVNFIAGKELGLSYSMEQAGKFVAYYWGGAMAGRFIGSVIMQKIDAKKVLAVCGLAAVAMVVVSMTATGHVAMVAILLVGLFNSVMFPTIFSLSIAGLGSKTSQGSALLNMAIVGGALIPLIQAGIADMKSIQFSLIVPLVCYVYITFFAFKGASADEK